MEGAERRGTLSLAAWRTAASAVRHRRGPAARAARQTRMQRLSGRPFDQLPPPMSPNLLCNI